MVFNFNIPTNVSALPLGKRESTRSVDPPMCLLMESIASIYLGFFVFFAVLQLFWGYALSTIARKGGQSDLMQVLAWIPLLQIAPMIVAGGGSVQGFVLGSIGLFVGALVLGIVSAFLGGTVGGAISGLCMAFAFLLTFVYFGRLCWTMATDRNLSGWVGLLLFVPVVNFFVYPFIAFHDGWTSPNKLGLAIGLVLTIGATAPSFQLVRTMNQEGGFPPEFAALMSGDSELMDLFAREGFAPTPERPEFGMAMKNSEGLEIDPTASIRALYSMQDRFERLRLRVESPEIGSPKNKQQAIDLLRSIEAELKAHRSVLDGRTYQQLATDLVESEARILGETNAKARGGISLAKPWQTRSGSPETGMSSPAAIDSNTANLSAPLRPLPSQPTDGCPDGTQLRSRATGQGEEEWCQQLDEAGGLRHGWYAHYLESGRPESVGEYANGLRIGVWTRFYPSGRVRAQAEFAEGLQHGWLLSFNDSGKRTQAVRFDRGVARP
jgi:hypothetical protein